MIVPDDQLSLAIGREANACAWPPSPAGPAGVDIRQHEFAERRAGLRLGEARRRPAAAAAAILGNGPSVPERRAAGFLG